RAGAADYLAKPWDDDKLVTCVRNLLELGRLARESGELKKQRRSRRETLARDHDLGSLLYDSDAMHELVTLAVKVARSDLPVLITGPNGAGKEMIADIVQRNSAVAVRSIRQGERRRAAGGIHGSGTVRRGGGRLHRRGARSR